MPDPDLRAQIRNEIANFTPIDAAEHTVIADALDLLDSGAEIFRHKNLLRRQSMWLRYFLLVDGDHILLVDHIKAGLWLPSGGHVARGEHPRQTVQREIVEELGIEANVIFAGLISKQKIHPNDM